MHQQPTIAVYGNGGLRGTAEFRADEAAAGRPVLIRLNQGDQIVVPADLLQRRPDGSLYLPVGPNELDRYRPADTAGQEVSIPVAEEKLRVDRRKVETGKVVVTKTVQEHEEVVDQPTIKEEVQVERVPINRVVEGPVEIRQEGDTTIIPLLEEVLVIQKKLMLREEVRVTRRRTETRQPQKVKLRKEQAQVERLPGEAAETPAAR